VFLLLRRHSRTGLLQDAVSAYDLALQFPIGPHAWSSQRQHYFIDCLLRLLHRVFFRLYGAGGAADGELLGKTTQITRRTVDHSLLENDNRTVFLMERSKALQLWFVRAADVESLCLAIALLHRQLIAAPFKGVECPTCHFWRLAQKYWNIGVSVMSFEISIMDAIIAFFRDVVQRCPAGHHSAQALSEDLVRMLKSRCAVNHDSSLHDEYLLLSMHSLLGPSSAELSTADKCITLSLDMLSRFRDTRNYDQLAHAARLCEAALERCPPDHPSRAAVYHSARSVYSARYEDDGDLSLLRRAIQLQQQAVMHATVDDADRAKMCGSLKYSLYRAFQREGHVSDLEGWVAMAREVLRLCPNRDHDRAGACNELAVALIEVFVKSGLLSAYEEAMERCEEAILCTSPGHPTRARVAENLTNAAVYYSGRKEPQEEGNLGLLRRAVALQQEVLQLNLAPEVQPIERAMTQCNLARTMSALDAYLGGYESEQECIALYRSALSLVPETHRGRSVACSGLLEIFQGRLTRTGELASLDAAICEAREAMRFTYPTDSSYYGIRGALADALRTRFRFFGQSADLDEAISVLRMLLSGMSPTDSNRIIACPSLASSLHMEYQRTGDMSRLEEAISLQQEAYTICPKGRLGRVAVCSDYALFLVDQFRATGNCALLDRAIEFYRETLLLELPGHAERPSCLSNLGACLGQRFKYGGDLASLNEGIQLLREAVELRPPRHAKRGVACSNLATILLVHMLHTKDNSYMEETIYLCEEACGAGDSKMRITSLSSYLCLSSVYCIPGTLFFNPAAAVVALRAATHNIHEASLPVDLIAHLNSLDLDLIPESHMRDMLSIFSSVISCLPRLSNATMTLHTRLRTLKASKNLGAASLHCAVMVGDLKTSVELVEKSRAVFWSQALNMRDPQLENLPNDLRTEIERLLHALSSPPTLLEDSQLTARDVFHRRHEQLQTLIAEVRTLPGLAHFMLGTSYDKLVNVIHDSVVVIFSADKGACRAIILRGANLHPVHLQLDELCADELDELSAPLADLGMRHGSTKNPCGDNERALGISGRQNGGSPMERLLSKLWFKVMKPVLQALDYRTVRTMIRICQAKRIY
jgi:tetratricopeptide (TPR) repeat protein